MHQDNAAKDDESFLIPVELRFVPYMADALARLSYTARSFALDVVGSSFRVTARRPANKPTIIRKINHALYREKVRAESGPLRARFLELLSQR